MSNFAWIRLLVLIVVLIGLAAWFIVPRTDFYRYRRMVVEYEAFRESEDDANTIEHFVAAEAHRDALARSGALLEDDFTLRPMDRNSDDFAGLCELLDAECGDGPLVEFQWPDSDKIPAALRVWYRPQDLARWEALLQPYRPVGPQGDR